MTILKDLLAPYPLEQFLEKYWLQKAIHISTDNPQKFQRFFSWDNLNYLLNNHTLEENNLRFSMKGQLLPYSGNPQEYAKRLREGATLIVNGVHHRVPTVNELTAHLRYDIGYPAHVNLYCSPGQQQGFNCHYDTHDVIILQIDGEKEWFVFDETMPNPVPDMPSENENPPEGLPYLRCILKPGDFLYIPRGHWHYAIACDKLSLHLTIGIDCQTGLDWANSILKNLQSSPEWRASLPAIIDGNTNVIERQLYLLKQRLIETLQQPNTIHQYIESLNSKHQPKLPVSLPIQMGDDIFQDVLTTRFYWSPLHRLRVKELGQEHYQFQVGSNKIYLKGISEGFVENLCNTDEFGLFDMADWAPELDLEADIAPIITRLVREGVLLVKY